MPKSTTLHALWALSTWLLLGASSWAGSLESQMLDEVPNLAAYWNFNEGSGTTVSDSSPNGNTGTFGGGANAPVFMPGRAGAGTAIQFDGNDYISVADSPSVSLTSDFTLSAWINVRNGSSGARNILAKDANNSYRWRVDGDSSLWLLVKDSGSPLEVVDSGFPAPNDDSWHNTMVRFDAGTQTADFFLDGVLVGTRATTTSGISDTAGALLLGAYSPGGEGFNGLLDDIAIFNASLSFQVDGSNNLIGGDLLSLYQQGPVGLLPPLTPEPSTLLLASLALVAGGWFYRQRRRRI